LQKNEEHKMFSALLSQYRKAKWRDLATYRRDRLELEDAKRAFVDIATPHPYCAQFAGCFPAITLN